MVRKKLNMIKKFFNLNKKKYNLKVFFCTNCNLGQISKIIDRIHFLELLLNDFISTQKFKISRYIL